MKKIVISVVLVSFTAFIVLVLKQKSVKTLLESNVDALVEVSNSEYKIKCNGYTQTAVEEWIESYSNNSSKMGYISTNGHNYCGVEGHPSCGNEMYKCKKSKHTEKCYHPTDTWPLHWPSSDPL